MAGALAHRGPDDSGVWIDTDAGLAFGHRRLAIVDLSPGGRQPMVSACGRYVLVFNGQIYNFLELRRELDQDDVPPPWRGHCDTEVLLEAVVRWGLAETLRRVVGMYAFAVWDRRTRVLSLARDRLGEKPLYYGWQGNTFAFASEMKALRMLPSFHGEIDRNALALFVRYNYIPAPFSIYSGIYKLLPGTWLTMRADQVGQAGTPTPYWSTRDAALRGVAHPFAGSPEDGIDELDRLLCDAVRHEMIADVPIGALLSGGVDSSTIVAMMQKYSGRPVKTFTVGFYEGQYNEAERAKEVARYLGTEHTELYVSPREAWQVIPRLPELYDEPFADPSAIPTFLVAQLARKEVAVLLSGDAADELFCGYSRYFSGSRIWNTFNHVPRPLLASAATALTTLDPETWDAMLTPLGGLLPDFLGQERRGNKIYRMADMIRSARGAEELYLALTGRWSARLVQGTSYPPRDPLMNGHHWSELPAIAQRLMALDQTSYLPDDVLVKVDRATMGMGLELRAPFLDHRVVEFSWQVPIALQRRMGTGKWLVRQLLYRYVPRHLVDRPKMGFEVPIDAWLRGELRPWAEELLSPERLRREGWFDPKPIRKKWDEHQSGRFKWDYHLWTVLMFQAWLARQQVA